MKHTVEYVMVSFLKALIWVAFIVHTIWFSLVMVSLTNPMDLLKNGKPYEIQEPEILFGSLCVYLIHLKILVDT